jgi:hypothetical protein
MSEQAELPPVETDPYIGKPIGNYVALEKRIVTRNYGRCTEYLCRCLGCGKEKWIQGYGLLTRKGFGCRECSVKRLEPVRRKWMRDFFGPSSKGKA